jgi:hypothetical protein
VLDSVGVIQACFFEELLEVVLSQLYIELAIIHDLCGVFSAGDARLLVDAAIDVDSGLLTVLLAPLLAGLGDLLGTLDGDVGRCFPAANWGWSKSHHHGTGDVMGGDAAPSFGVALGGVNQRVEGSQK